ncbi:hypothetical protein [Flavobacterium sp. HNIBRBA15423]|uniref:hypothetical protein n=1 Tax=Flavobacterium sp. HNIBRBA15423 TaxID=3458683 RepID=UPI004043EC8B
MYTQIKGLVKITVIAKNGIRKRIKKNNKIAKKTFNLMDILNRIDTYRVILKIIAEANESLVLISPYVKLNNELKKCFVNCKAKNKTLIFREQINYDDYKFLQSVGFSLVRNFDLHSKIYLNHNEILFSSMNLYDYSITNNLESSVLLQQNEVKESSLKVIQEILKNIRK